MTNVLSPPYPGVPISPSRADAALEVLHAEHHLRLLRLATLLIGDTGRAEEVVQDAFVEVYRRYERIEPGKAAAYLRQTVVNRSRSTLRHLRVVRRTPEHEPRPAEGADQSTLAGERRRAVVDALAALPRRQREVLVLRHYLELSEAEIAETLGISRGAVKSHASRGSATLRTTLAAYLEDR